MEEAEGAGEVRVLEVVGEVAGDLVGGEHPLIDQGAAGEAGEIEVLVVVEAGVLDGGLEPLADDVELALEAVGVVVGGLQGDLEHGGLDPLGGLAEAGVVDLEGAPAEDTLALLGGDDLEHPAAEGLLLGVGGGEQGADAVFQGLGELDPDPREPAGEEGRGASGSGCPRRRRYSTRRRWRRGGRG